MRIYKLVMYILTFVQLGLFTGTSILQNLYSKKMGVARYIQFKNVVFNESVFSNSFLKLYSVVFILSLLVSILLVMKSSKFKIKNKSFVRIISLGALISFIGIYFSIFGNIDTYKALYFFIIASLVSLVIQYIKIGLYINHA